MKNRLNISSYRVWCFALFLILAMSLCLLAAVPKQVMDKPLAEDIRVASANAAATPLPIIMYHSIFHKDTGKYVLHPEQLEKDFIYIKNNGYTTIVVKDLIDFIENGVPLPDKPIMLTFDDGAKTKYLYAFPLLKKYDLRAVFAVVGKWIDDEEVKKGSSLTYEQIKEMADSGLVEIQSHSYDMHKSKGRVGMRQKKGECENEYRQALKEDLGRVKDSLNDRLGIKVTAVAYPFGAFSDLTNSILRELGYKAVFICTEKVNFIDKDSDLFNLCRFNRPSGISSERFFAKLK